MNNVINLAERRAMRDRARHTIGTTSAAINKAQWEESVLARARARATARALEAEEAEERAIAECIAFAKSGGSYENVT